jgi:hypothetical protein
MLVAVLLATGVVAGPASADPTMTGKEARKLFTKMGCKEVWAYAGLAKAIWRGQDSVSASEIDPEWMARINTALNKTARIYDITGATYWWPAKAWPEKVSGDFQKLGLLTKNASYYMHESRFDDPYKFVRAWKRYAGPYIDAQDRKFMKIDGAIDSYFDAKSDCGFTSSSRPLQGRLVADR